MSQSGASGRCLDRRSDGVHATMGTVRMSQFEGQVAGSAESVDVPSRDGKSPVVHTGSSRYADHPQSLRRLLGADAAGTSIRCS